MTKKRLILTTEILPNVRFHIEIRSILKSTKTESFYLLEVMKYHKMPHKSLGIRKLVIQVHLFILIEIKCNQSKEFAKIQTFSNF